MAGPKDYMNQYFNVLVPDDKETKAPPTNVKIWRYRNNDLGAELGTQGAMGNDGPKDALVGKLRELLPGRRLTETPQQVDFIRGRRITVDVHKVVGVYSGKGSPEEIADILWIARRLWLADVPCILNAPVKTIRLDATWPLQKYCDEYVGVDCNGFVGNYVQNVMRLPRYDANTRIQDYPPRGQYRTRLEDVRAEDVLIWPHNNFGHIAIIDSVGVKTPDNILDCEVAESSPAYGGLHCGTYSIRPPNDDNLFKVDRYTEKGGFGQVYIVGLK